METATGLTAEEIFIRTGIRSRAKLEGESLLDLCVRSAQLALGKKDFSEVEALIFATSSPVARMPATASIIQDALPGMKGLCFDLNAACTGFKLGMNLLDGMIRTGQIKNCLLIGADAGTQMVDYEASGPSLLFGDGAGAFFFEASTDGKSGFLSHADRSVPGFSREIFLAHGKGEFMTMNGPRVFAEAVKEMTSLGNEAVRKTGLSLDDINWIVPHQANSRILEAVGWKMPFPQDKIILDLEDIGNTLSASVPIAFDRHQKKFRRGDHILFLAFAAGFTGGASVMRY